MADEQTAPTGGSEPVSNDTSKEALESKLASFDFGDAEPPKKKSADDDAAQPKEAGDDEAMATVAAEAKAEQPATEDDDPEETLRDGRKVKRSELKRGYRPDWEARIQQHMQREQAFAQATNGFNQAQQQTATSAAGGGCCLQNAASAGPELGRYRPVRVPATETHLRHREGQAGRHRCPARCLYAADTAAAVSDNSTPAPARTRGHVTGTSRPEGPREGRRLWRASNLGAQLGYTPAELAQVRDHG